MRAEDPNNGIQKIDTVARRATIIKQSVDGAQTVALYAAKHPYWGLAIVNGDSANTLQYNYSYSEDSITWVDVIAMTDAAPSASVELEKFVKSQYIKVTVQAKVSGTPCNPVSVFLRIFPAAL